MLCEGNSVRAIAQMLNVGKNTVLNLMLMPRGPVPATTARMVAV
jgi:hypothetical protein